MMAKKIDGSAILCLTKKLSPIQHLKQMPSWKFGFENFFPPKISEDLVFRSKEETKLFEGMIKLRK